MDKEMKRGTNCGIMHKINVTVEKKNIPIMVQIKRFFFLIKALDLVIHMFEIPER